ncbi:MAG: accessory factor UbiK family protein [Gammaproteobacteria bacterium]
MNEAKQSPSQRFEAIASRVIAALPGGAALGEDLRNNLRAALAGAFARMNLVTQEEFEVQSAVLARTRARLEALEQRVRDLESGQRAGPG